MSENNLPDKCDFCGLKQTYPFEIGDSFQKLRLLFEKGIIPKKFPRKVYAHVGGDGIDTEEFCLISHPSWSTKGKKCGSWQLDIDLPKGDSLSINLASEMRDMTKKLNLFTKVIIVFTFLQICILVKPDVLRYISLIQ